MRRTLMVLLVVAVLSTATTAFADNCGDVNNSGIINALDVTYLINYLYKHGPAPICGISYAGLCGDVNGDGKINALDITYLINKLYKHGPEPVCLYATPSTTTIIPPTDTTVIQNYDTTTGTVILDGSSIYAQRVSVSDVIIGQDDGDAPNGFLRKVTSKTTQGGSIVLKTEQATMMEAFESMHIADIHQLRPSDVKSYELYNGAKFNPNRGDDTFAVEWNHVFYDQDDDLETTEDQIRLSGEYKFTAALFTNIEMSWFTLQKFEAGIETNQNVNIDLTANLQWTLDEEKELMKFQLGAIPVGGVVWLVPTLTVKAHIKGDLTVTFETGISFTQELRYGLGYANNDYYEIGESAKDFTYTPPQFMAEFNFEPGVSLNVACLLYGVAGPYMGGKAGIHFQSALNADPCDVNLTFDLEAILYAVLGVQCDILDLDYSNDYPLYTYPIGEWIYHLGGSGTIVIDAEPNTINAPWSLAGPCSYSASGNGDNTLTSLDPGDYTMTWGAVPDWTAPSNSMQTLRAGQTVTFSGTYIENTIPALTTAAVSAITQTTAQCGGNITDSGSASVTARGVCWSTHQTPTIADSVTTDGTGTGSFTSSIFGLTAGTTYYVRAYATNSVGTGYGNEIPFTTSPSGTVTDFDGNVYQTKIIGTQEWMAENLKVTHYNTGDAIPNVTNGATWAALTTGAYCEYNNDGNNVATYGRLYNWYAINDSRDIAPVGWHVPTDAEFQTLIDYLGGATIAGGKMKEAGYTHWYSPNTGATNESGFSGLPGGGRFGGGSYLWMRSYAYFWSSTQINNSLAWPRGLYYARLDVRRDSNVKQQGFSVRCVKD